MYAIETKFMPPTNTRGPRISVRITDRLHSTTPRTAAIYVPYDHALSSSENHRAAATALLSAIRPHGTWVAGETERGFVFCNVPSGVSGDNTALHVIL